MNVILGQDYYSLLEINRFASKSEIVKAYHRLKAAFDPESLATYSLFDPGEARMIAARVEEALRVLIDDRKKEVYDRWLQARERGEDLPEPVFTRDAANDQAVAAAVSTGGTTEVKPFVPRKVPTLRPVPPGGFPDTGARPAAAQTSSSSSAAASAATAPAPAPPPAPLPAPSREVFSASPAPATNTGITGPPIGSRPPSRLPPIDEEAIRKVLSSAADRDGSFFRGLREARQLTVQQIAEITKINVMYLRFIEDNNYRDMPAPVYLRGFLVQLARFHKLEAPDAIAEAYMTVMEKRKKEST